MTEPRILFKTQHGSKLYGLAHAHSDDDYYVVTNSHAKGKQSVVDGIDTLRVGFARFVDLASIGSHQALEAMFSDEPIYDEISEFRASFYAAGAEVNHRYLRTIKNFSFAPEMKRRRHAIRLAMNLRDIRRYGRFQPKMTEKQIIIANEYTDPGDHGGSQRYMDFLETLLDYSLDD